MMMMQKYTHTIQYLALTALIAWCALPQEAMAQEDAAGAGIPLRFASYDSLENYISSHGDTLIVVNFWATWCKPCVRELPFFQALDTHFEGRKAKVLLVSLDLPKDIDTKLFQFAEDWDIVESVAALTDMDHNGWIPRVDEHWTGAIPATWVLYQGRSAFHEGEFDDWEALIEFVNSIAP